MAKRRNRRNPKETSILGALFIEGLAVIIMLSLFYVTQHERSTAEKAQELVYPNSVESPNEYYVGHPGSGQTFTSYPTDESTVTQRYEGDYSSSRRTTQSEVVYSAPLRWRTPR